MPLHVWIELSLMAIIVLQLGVIAWLLDGIAWLIERERQRHGTHEARRCDELPMKKGMGERPHGRPPLD